MKVDFDEDERAVLDAFDKSVSALDVSAGPEQLRQAGRDLGQHGWLEIAQRSGESGMSFSLLAGCAERLGDRQHQLAFPLLETWTAIRILEQLPGQDELVAALCKGAQLATVATDLLDGNDCGTTSGYVPYAAEVDVVLVPLLRADGWADVHVVRPGDLAIVAANPVDPSLRAGYLDELTLTPNSFAGTATDTEMASIAAEFLVLQAAEMTGAASWLFEQTLRYLTVREQFGAYLSTFQALQHRASDLAVRLDSARSLVVFAAWAVDRRTEDHIDYARLAKGYVGENGIEIAAEAIQLHGGQGFTVEMGLHHTTQRIMHRAITGLHCREALIRVGARAIDRQQLVGGFVPGDLRPDARS
jgi:hypothetical protein